MKASAWRRAIGVVAVIISAITTTWLILAMLALAPAPEIRLIDQSGIRLLAEITVLSFLVAAFGFWDE